MDLLGLKLGSGWIRGPGWVRGFRLEPHGPPEPEISGAGLNPPPQRVHRLGGWWWRGVLTGASFSRVGFGRVSLGAHARWGRDALLCADLVEPVVEALPGLRGAGTGLWVVAHSAPTEDFHTLLDKLEDPPADPPVPEVDVMSNFLFIFTSGTTGLSKAARVGHLKALGSMAFLDLCGATCEDVVYITLPLYHMSASLLGVGGCIHLGATCVLRRKFSARHFWKDCVRHDVTVVQYIGELCRYLLNQPPVLEERAHCVRLAAGSGLRSDVWRKFITRFGIRQVREGYGLTETSIGFLNYTDEVGPIGRASYFNKLSIPFKLLKFDPDTNEPVRTDSGRCIQAPAGEAGLLVAPLTAGNQFLGYAGSSEQSEKKLLRDLFEDGDVYFNTGDLLLRDHRDFLYFRDRLGDTFRWKGENVSTTEVSEALCLLDFIQEATVYGVSIPGNEGRAGMAALVLRAGVGLEGKSLYEHLGKTLPSYAWPRFIRIQTALDVTETFKQRKGKLVQEGFDPQASQDPLYVLDVSQRDYRLLTTSLFQDITSGKISL
ncbi:long-chain fatty acid transport protein 3 [Menidia menidia]